MNARTARTSKPSPKPSGSDEVRAAILAAAGRHFARHGTAASLRDIAADANVNLGLIHRHFGNKDALIRAVLESHANAGAGLARRSTDLAGTVQQIFGHDADGAQYIKMLAWLLLENAPLEQFQTQYPTINALRGLAADEEQELHLLAAFALIYGWTVFGDQLLAAFGHKARARHQVEQRLAAILGQLVAS
ncbi:MAG: helix-turn-helix domain-containing protein [Acidimicrobiales bacterium]